MCVCKFSIILQPFIFVAAVYYIFIDAMKLKLHPFYAQFISQNNINMADLQ